MKEILDIKKDIESVMYSIKEKRDLLRELQSDLEDSIDCLDRGIEDLEDGVRLIESGIDSFSERV